MTPIEAPHRFASGPIHPIRLPFRGVAASRRGRKMSMAASTDIAPKTGRVCVCSRVGVSRTDDAAASQYHRHRHRRHRVASGPSGFEADRREVAGAYRAGHPLNAVSRCLLRLVERHQPHGKLPILLPCIAPFFTHTMKSCSGFGIGLGAGACFASASWARFASPARRDEARWCPVLAPALKNPRVHPN